MESCERVTAAHHGSPSFVCRVRSRPAMWSCLLLPDAGPPSCSLPWSALFLHLSFLRRADEKP